MRSEPDSRRRTGWEGLSLRRCGGARSRAVPRRQVRCRSRIRRSRPAAARSPRAATEARGCNGIASARRRQLRWYTSVTTGPRSTNRFATTGSIAPGSHTHTETRRGNVHPPHSLAEPDHTSYGACSPDSLIPTGSTSPRPASSSHVLVGSASTGVYCLGHRSRQPIRRTHPCYRRIPTSPADSSLPTVSRRPRGPKKFTVVMGHHYEISVRIRGVTAGKRQNHGFL